LITLIAFDDSFINSFIYRRLWSRTDLWPYFLGFLITYN
jgi:hypothetical protein